MNDIDKLKKRIEDITFKDRITEDERKEVHNIMRVLDIMDETWTKEDAMNTGINLQYKVLYGKIVK